MTIRNAKISNPGVTIEDYLAQTVKRGDPQFVMRSGELREFFECPMDWVAYGAPVEDEEEEKEKLTRGLLWGSLLDCLVTCPHELEDKFVFTPPTYRNKAGETKEWSRKSPTCRKWEAEARQEGIEPVDPKFFNKAKQAAKLLTEDRHISKLLAGASYQGMVTAEFEDDGNVVPFKCLIDIVPPRQGPYGDCIANLKTAYDVRQRPWIKAIVEHGYDIQGALELDLYNAAMPDEARKRYLHPIQKSKPPFTVGRRALSQDFLHIGREKYTRALRWYMKCLKAQVWPGLDDLASSGWTEADPRPFDMADV